MDKKNVIVTMQPIHHHDEQNNQQNSETMVKRNRRSKEELMQAALAERESIDLKINRLKAAVNETARKKHNRGLTLLGFVVEQCIKNKTFEASPPPTLDMTWWHEQAKLLLPEKDRAAYVEFLNSLNITNDLNEAMTTTSLQEDIQENYKINIPNKRSNGIVEF